MEAQEQVDPIHDLVLQIFGEIEGALVGTSEMRKSVLVRDGHYCGRAFNCRDLRAVWFAEANELKFYRQGGPLLRAVRLNGAAQLCRAA